MFKAILEIILCIYSNAIFYTRNPYILKGSFALKFIRKLPRGHWSQEGQDKIAEEILVMMGVDIGNLKIVDVGANHPVVINNTQYFESQRSAKVHSIEPNPFFIPLYKEHNRELINCAIGYIEEELILHIPTRSLMLEYNDNVHASLLAEELDESALRNKESIKVEVRRLGSVIEPDHYNILFIDVEGFELEVLKGIDFNQFSFDVIFIENNSTLRPLHVIRNYLVNQGYSFHARIHGLDDIFLRLDRN